MRGNGESANDEFAWAREAFTWDPSPREALIQRGRNVKAEVRYWWWRQRNVT
jgi:hypothetical protein